MFCNFVIVCNGKCWIIFRLNFNVKLWKKFFVYVIKDLNYFIEDYVFSINLFGYISLIEEDFLNKNIGVGKKIYNEIFYFKNNIIVYDIFVDNNKYVGVLNIILNKYFGLIFEDDIDFMDKCYVSNKGKYDDL